jgi:hypothetical protein
MKSLSRRKLLQQCSNGFGFLALTAMLSEHMPAMFAGEENVVRNDGLHLPARAKNVIFLFMDGGPSQVDTFDPKPLLNERHGERFPASIDATQFDQNGTIFGTPFKFAPRGNSGLPISELFPNLAEHADKLCVIRSMKSDFAEHSQACMFLHTGSPIQGRPSLGSWLNYGLGSVNEELPGYVVVNGGLLPIGGPENFSNSFLPAIHQGTFFNTFGNQEIVQNVKPAFGSETQKSLLDFIRRGDKSFVDPQGDGDEANRAIEGAIKNYETAMAMQTAVPELVNFSTESEATLKSYGVDSKNPLTAQYAKQCLLARRLVESGVRFVELTCVKGIRFIAPWDDHDNIQEGHRKNAEVVDQPVAALITDLAQRGLLDSTLLVFAGEFGRTPFAQGSRGRDHNPQGFSIWMAGGGVKGGFHYGSTDEFGYRAVDQVVSMHDLHATILHLLGIDHERLTFRWGGRDFRLTDVYGNVVKACLA